MCRTIMVTLPTGGGGVGHLFEKDSEKLSLINRLFSAVLAGDQAVCVEQLLLIVGDFNAAPGIIPCLAKSISSGRSVDLALAFSLGVGKGRNQRAG